MSDAEILTQINTAFGHYSRPEHFTDFTHCSECAEHDALLRSRGRGDLRVQDVSNPGWNPICFVSNEAFLYLVPDLALLALLPTESDWSFPNLLFHLTNEHGSNRYLTGFTAHERSAVMQLLRHIAATRGAALENYLPAGEIGRAIDLWERGA